jgi:hypothetical protein
MLVEQHCLSLLLPTIPLELKVNNNQLDESYTHALIAVPEVLRRRQHTNDDGIQTGRQATGSHDESSGGSTRTLRVDGKDTMQVDADVNIRDLICAPVSKTSVERVPIWREQISDCLEGSNFELVRFLQYHLSIQRGDYAMG